MRVISLNAWCATNKTQLESFLREEAPRTDIFLFQEVTRSDKDVFLSGSRWFSNSKAILDGILEGFDSQYQVNATKKDSCEDSYENVSIVEFDFGTAIYSRLPITSIGSHPVLDSYSAYSTGMRCLQWAKVETSQGPRVFATLHGYWTPDKNDCPERLEQARRSRAFLDALKVPVVFAGDFNIAPDTESLAIMKGPWRELVTEYGVPTTRGPSYTGNAPHADYCIVSPGIAVRSFSVPVVDASDHLPLILEFD